MKFKGAVNKFLTNKLVLNIVALIALICVISYVVMGKFNLLIYFIVFAVLLRFFSKNMIIILGIPVILVTLLSYKKGITEGLENIGETNKKQNPKNKPKKESMENLEYGQFKQNKQNKQNNKQDPKTSQGLPQTPITPEDATMSSSAIASTDGVMNDGESFEVGRGKRRTGPHIDYAATVEDAYGELNKILGSDGVKRLTDDTQRLMKQQMQLAESMKSMTPLIQGMGPMLETAKGLMKGMGDNKEEFGSILKLADKLNDTK